MRRAENKTYRIANNSDIAPDVTSGRADFALLGSDKFGELPPDSGLMFEPLGKLPCLFTLQIPKTVQWDRGKALTVATSYPRALTAFVAQTGIRATCTLVLNGKVEGAVASGLTDAGFEIFETGGNAQANGLRVVAEGPPLELGGLWKQNDLEVML